MKKKQINHAEEFSSEKSEFSYFPKPDFNKNIKKQKLLNEKFDINSSLCNKNEKKDFAL